MKIYATISSLIIVVLLLTSSSYALERKQLVNINTDQMIEETQLAVPCDDGHINIVWWIPNEFWNATYARDEVTSKADKRLILNVLKPYIIIGIVQADISDFGAFQYYSKEEILNNLKFTVKTEDGKLQKMVPIEDFDPDLEMIIGMFKPVLSAAMGNLGQNLHFYVLKATDASGRRQLDPYLRGALNVQLGKRDGALLEEGTLELPINSLYVPRRCPNGKEAYVTWRYCPWTGKKLDE